MFEDNTEKNLFDDPYEDTTILADDSSNFEFIARYSRRPELVTSNVMPASSKSPFKLFTDVYMNLQNPVASTKFRIEDYFEGTDSPIIEIKGKEMETHRLHHKDKKFNTIPLIILRNGSNDNLMKLQEIRENMCTVMRNFGLMKEESKGKYEFLHLSIDAYVTNFFADISLKWLQWVEAVNFRGGTHQLKIHHPYTLSTMLKEKFFRNHFCFKIAGESSLKDFKSSINNAVIPPVSEHHCEHNRFGLFINLDQGVAVFVSPIKKRLGTALGGTGCGTACPTRRGKDTIQVVTGSHITRENSQAVNDLLYFYVHLACIYTFAENVQ